MLPSARFFGKTYSPYTAVCHGECRQLLFQCQYVGRHCRIVEYSNDVACPHRIPIVPIQFLQLAASLGHNPHRRMFGGHRHGSVHRVGILEEASAHKNKGQHSEEHRDAPSYQRMRRPCQNLLHFLAPQFYLFLFHRQSPTVRFIFPTGSSPVCSTALPLLSVPRAYPVR